MVQDINQFNQTPVKGMITGKENWNTFQAQVSTNEAATLVPGQAVLIEDTAIGPIAVVKATATTDDIFGFLPYTTQKSEWVALDSVKVCTAGDELLLEAGAAIARGADVEFVVSGNKVQTQATGTVIGKALDKAAADGDLIRVLLK